MNQSVAIIIVTLLILVGTFAINLLISSRISKKEASSASEDWEVGGRSLPLFVVVGTQFATAMGGGLLVGQVGNGYKNGLSVMLYGVLCQLAFIILMIIAKWLREKQFATIPEIVEHFSGPSKAIRIMSGILTIIVPMGWICGQLSAFGKLYSSITGIPIPYLVVFLAVASLFFVMPSGLKTVAWTDFIFGVLMFATAILVCRQALGLGGGLGHVVETVPPEIVEFPGAIFSVGWYTTILWIFSLVPGSLTNQMYYQRIFACKEEKQVRKSLLISAAVCLSAYVWAVIVGLCVRSLNPNLADSEMATGWLLTQLPTWVVAIFSGLVIAAILSTVSSGAQSVVVNLNRDIYRVIHPDVDEKKILTISKVLSVVVMTVCTVLALFFPSVINMLVTSYSFSSAGLLCPIFLCYAMRKKKFITKNAIIAGMAVGILGCGISMSFNTAIPYSIWGIVSSFVAMLVVSAVDKNKVVTDDTVEE